MRTITTTAKALGLVVAIFTTLTVGAASARADEVFFAGFTQGCFGLGCTPGDTASIPGLFYSGSTFSGTTFNNFRALGGNANPGSNFNNLGSFSLSTEPNRFADLFFLHVTFTAPEGINGGNQAKIEAVVIFDVRSDDEGGTFFDFNDTPVFTFSDTNCGATTVPGQQTTCGNGRFSFTVNDLSLDPGQTGPVSGQMGASQQPAAVPEPMSLLLLGTGVLGAAGAARRRKRLTNAKE